MRRLYELHDRWNAQSLAVQFLLAGGLVSFAAMLIVGFLVTSQIEEGVTRNSAATTALYVDSVIAPLLPDMRKTRNSAIRSSARWTRRCRRARSANASSRSGFGAATAPSSTPRIRASLARSSQPSDDLTTAWTGRVVAQFNQLDDLESAAERARDEPLLEIYNPVLQPWSGEVVAVSEFYEVAADFEKTLRNARLWSWLAVVAQTLAVFALLSVIVFRGSRMIETQSRALKERVGELSRLLSQNRQLRLRVQRASQRVAALNERYMRRVGADLHDGPAQLVALAALRLDSDALTSSAAPEASREREILAIKSSLDEAMREIRNICNGLVLPHIETAELAEILRLAVAAHEQRTGASVSLSMSGTPGTLSPSEKICVYRFVQEALNNSYRHAGGTGQAVRAALRGRQAGR